MQIKTSCVSKMDPKSKVNSADYVKSLIFARKEFALQKLIDILNGPIDNEIVKQTLMKIYPIFFSFAQLNNKEVGECLTLITKIKRHPSFAQEKNMFDGWQARLRNLLPGMTKTTASEIQTESNENRFFNIPGTNMMEMIGYADPDLFLRYNKWLKYHKLHKYLYFFANLSVHEIESITKENIRNYETKVGIHPMTEGARNAILRKLAELNQRAARLQTFSTKEYYFRVSEEESPKRKVYKIEVSKIEKSINEIRMILKTPIRKNDFFSNSTSNLPDLIGKAVETVVSVILRLTKEDELTKVSGLAISLLKMAWGCSFFDPEVKKKFNVLQTELKRKEKSFSYSQRKVISRNTEMCNNRLYIDRKTVQFIDIEKGIQAITWYLENVVLKDSI